MELRKIEFKQNGSNYEAVIYPQHDFNIHLASSTAGKYNIMRSIKPNESEDNGGYYSVFSIDSVKVLDTGVTNWYPNAYCKIVSTVPLTSAYYG